MDGNSWRELILYPISGGNFLAGGIHGKTDGLAEGNPDSSGLSQNSSSPTQAIFLKHHFSKFLNFITRGGKDEVIFFNNLKI